MCLILFAWEKHPKYRLILAANRDEFYQRATTRAQWWENTPEVFAGRDLVAGGTWLGVSTSGRMAAVTNVREPHNIRPDAPSRGALTTDFLTGNQAGGSYLHDLAPSQQAYNGFNLLLLDPSGLWYGSNRINQPQLLSSGIYGLSNKVLDTPWPKVEKGKAGLSELIQQPDIEADSLFGLLQQKDIFPDEKLPQTGVPQELERVLSALYIQSPNYGTRVSTVILWEYSGKVTVEERSYVPEGPSAQASLLWP